MMDRDLVFDLTQEEHPGLRVPLGLAVGVVAE